MEPNGKMMRQPEIVDRAVGPVKRAEFVPTEVQIRTLAHEIYRVRCDTGEAGNELADWVAAECELKGDGKDGARAIRRSVRADTSEVALGKRNDQEPTA